MNDNNKDPLAKFILEECGVPSDIKELKPFLVNSNKLLQRTVLGGRVLGGQSMYVQEYIYHKYLTDEQRREIYGSGYNIGSPDLIPNDSEQAFYDYLKLTYGGEDASELASSIKKGITDLTGIPFKIFLEKDRNLAWKVLTLFYRICRQHRSQLFNFLNKSSPEKANFEFRSSYPQKLERSQENTAILAEILGHLTFSMPQHYAEQAWLILDNLSIVGNNMSVYIRREVKGNLSMLPNQSSYSPDNIPEALDDLLKKEVSKPVYDRLDFLMYAALALREYSERQKSNELVAKVVYGTPLKLKSLNRAKINLSEDKDVLSFLFGKEITRIKPSLECQAKFVEMIIHHYSCGKDFKGCKFGELPRLNRQIIKALILHDEKLSIMIPSSVMGVGNVKKTVTSILKHAGNYAQKHPEGKFPELATYPEALLLYWVTRYHLTIDVLISNDMDLAFRTRFKIAKLESLLDSSLIDYLKFNNLSAYTELPELTEKFMKRLDYYPGKYINI